MVQINYVNGSGETVEALEKDSAEFVYKQELELFIILLLKDG